jgi:hypothetical protein
LVGDPTHPSEMEHPDPDLGLMHVTWAAGIGSQGRRSR